MTTISSNRLDEVITASKATLDQWANEQNAIANRMAEEAAQQYEQFEKRMEASRERLLALQLNRGLNLNGNDEQMNSELDQVQIEIQQQKEENEDLEVVLVGKKHAIERKFARRCEIKVFSQLRLFAVLLAERKKREAAVAEKQHEKEMTEIKSKATLDDLTRGLLCYKKLGMDLVKPDNKRLRLDFTQIDPENPEKVFTLEMAVEGSWFITKCPMLPSDTQNEVLIPLNEQNDIALFVRTVRKAFVDSLAR